MKTCAIPPAFPLPPPLPSHSPSFPSRPGSPQHTHKHATTTTITEPAAPAPACVRSLPSAWHPTLAQMMETHERGGRGVCVCGGGRRSSALQRESGTLLLAHSCARSHTGAHIPHPTQGWWSEKAASHTTLNFHVLYLFIFGTPNCSFSSHPLLHLLSPHFTRDR